MAEQMPTPDSLGSTQTSPLLASAALLLQTHQFRTTPMSFDGMTMLLAEDALFVIGLLEFTDLANLTAIEPAASLQLANRLVDPGAKQWDVYLVFLSQGSPVEGGLSEGVTEITYNTSYLRRVVRWQVSRSDDSIAQALGLFLPIPAPIQFGPVDPIQLLSERLPSYGVDATVVVSAVEQWRTADSRDETRDD